MKYWRVNLLSYLLDISVVNNDFASWFKTWNARNSCRFQNCDVGYRRTGGGLYLGTCEPCECFGHSSDCDSNTGLCRVRNTEVHNNLQTRSSFSYFKSSTSPDFSWNCKIIYKEFSRFSPENERQIFWYRTPKFEIPCIFHRIANITQKERRVMSVQRGTMATQPEVSLTIASHVLVHWLPDPTSRKILTFQ